MFPSPYRRPVILAERPSIDEALTTNTLISNLVVDVDTVVPARVAFSKLRTDEPGVLFSGVVRFHVGFDRNRIFHVRLKTNILHQHNRIFGRIAE